MGNKYGILQSSSKSCIFYKQDEDGNQSTFNIFVKPMIKIIIKQDISRGLLCNIIDSPDVTRDAVESKPAILVKVSVQFDLTSNESIWGCSKSKNVFVESLISWPFAIRKFDQDHLFNIF